jgi:hypothetical protein
MNPFDAGTPEYAEWERQESESPFGTLNEPPIPDAEPTYQERLRAVLVDAAGLDSIPDPEPLIGEDILFRDSLAWMVGKPGHGKSFVALDMAGCVGTGEMWQGYRVAQGTVLYLVAEGVRGVKKRVRAWEKAMGKPMSGVQFLPVAVQAAVGDQWAALIDLARELRPVLVILDTQARITVGMEENSNAEMGRFVDQVERLRKACAATVMIVHHIGRQGETGRGATTVDGALSTIIRVSKDEDGVTLECQKSKDGAEWDPIRLRMAPMGDSVVLLPHDGANRSAAKAPKWLAGWWEMHGSEKVSVSVLVKSGVVTEPTFHRYKRPLIDAGWVERIGEGSQTRYRLLRLPLSSDSHTLTPKGGESDRESQDSHETLREPESLTGNSVHNGQTAFEAPADWAWTAYDREA